MGKTDFQRLGDEEVFLALCEMEREQQWVCLAALRVQDEGRANRLLALLDADRRRERVRSPALAFAETADDELPVKVGAYTVHAVLGRGGMGSVYEVTQSGTGRRCALKLLQPGLANRHNIHRFRREGEVLAKMDHPGIARIYDAGVALVEYAGGASSEQPYLVLEFISGMDVATHVREVDETLEGCVRMVAEAADAVHYAHSLGIVHRDLKPANVMATAEGAVKVVDFGIARILEDSSEATTGLMPGTVAYMSPEQLLGWRDRIGTRTDIYGLGATLYALAVGHHPPMHGVAHELPDTWRTGKADRRLSSIIRKAMASAPEDRYASAAQFAEELRRWCSGDAILARPERLDWLRRLRRRHPRMLYGGTAAALVLVLFLANPEWRMQFRARLLPARQFGVTLLTFQSTEQNGSNEDFAASMQASLARSLSEGDVLEPVFPAATESTGASGSRRLLSGSGAKYAIATDFEASGSAPWSTLQVRARLVEAKSGRTVEVAAVQGSLADAESLVSDVALTFTEDIGGREQMLRLQHRTRGPDAEYEEAVRRLGVMDNSGAQRMLLHVLNRNYSFVPARLALARALGELGYRDHATRETQIVEEYARSAEERALARALRKELAGDPEGALQERASVRPLTSAEWEGLESISIAQDLIALSRFDEAGPLVQSGLKASGAEGASLRFRWMGLSAALMRTGPDHPRALVLAQSMVDLARRNGWTEAAAVALLRLSEALTFVGKQEASMQSLREATTQFELAGDRNSRIVALTQLAQREQIHGTNLRSIQITTALLHDVEHTEFARAEVHVLEVLGEALGRGYDLTQSRKMFSRALVISWAQPDEGSTRQILWRLGIDAREAGDLSEARRLLGLTIAPHQDDLSARALNSLGEAEVMAGRTDEALDAAGRASVLAGPAEDVAMDSLLVRTRALALRHDFRTLDTSFADARDTAARRGMHGSEALAEMQWGECLLWEGFARPAMAHLARAEALLEQIDRPAYRAEAAALLAIAWRRLGNTAAAKKAMQRALSVTTAPQYAYVRLLIGVAQAATANPAEAGQKLRATRAEADRLGLRAAVALADEELRRLPH